MKQWSKRGSSDRTAAVTAPRAFDSLWHPPSQSRFRWRCWRVRCVHTKLVCEPGWQSLCLSLSRSLLLWLSLSFVCTFSLCVSFLPWLSFALSCSHFVCLSSHSHSFLHFLFLCPFLALSFSLSFSLIRFCWTCDSTNYKFMTSLHFNFKVSRRINK